MLADRDEPLSAVRHQTVAVLFADIVGFTRMSEAIPPEAVASGSITGLRLWRYRQRAKPRVQRHWRYRQHRKPAARFDPHPGGPRWSSPTPSSPL
jgi:hypothetical protein